MKKMYFDNIPFKLELQEIGDILKLSSRESMMDILEEQIQIAEKTAVPKAAFIETEVMEIKGDIITICGQEFHSRKFSESVRVGQTIYPYIITIGRELEERYQEMDDIMEQYIMDGVQGVILGQVTDFIAGKLKEEFGLKDVAYHIPGELNDWDLADQPKLFELFGDTQNDLGVVLSHSNLMQPSKSVSGVYYEI